MFKGGQRNFKAAGRLKSGEMNKTERRYSDHLSDRLLVGEILWYKFEGIKLRLADNTFLTVDFAVLSADGLLEMHDVKGAATIWSDDSKVKMKVAAELYPFIFKVAFPIKARDGGGWDIHEI